MFLAIPVAALCFGGYVAAANAVSSQIEKDVVRLTAELDAQKQKNENNRLFLEELRKPGSPGFRAYAERIAYRDLGLSYPGDTIFVDPTATSP
jgi:cell division protein FtsB